MTETMDLDLYQAGHELMLSRSPDLVLKDAKRAAEALKDVVDQTKAVLKIGESEHLKNEAWQTLGHFYGLTGKIIETTFIQIGDVQGFKSVAELIHVASGKLVSRAESMCLSDEDKWNIRTKYAWAYVKNSGGLSIEDPGSEEIIWVNRKPKKQRVQIGEERVPLFQLMSMSETRAISRVHSNALKWVVILAGYNPTPAEEVDESIENGEHEPPPPIQQPQRKSQPNNEPKKTQPSKDDRLITDKEASRLWAIGYAAVPDVRQSLEMNQILEIVNAFGYQRVDEIKKSHYDLIIAAIQKGEIPTSDPDPQAA